MKDSVTLQAWIKPFAAFSNDFLNIYKLESNTNETLDFKVKMALTGGKNILTAYVGNYYITLSDYIPSGEIDNRGDDVLIPITAINTSFTHFSAVIRDNKVPEIYINGRHISQVYVAKMNSIFAKNTLSGTAPSATFTSNNLA